MNFCTKSQLPDHNAKSLGVGPAMTNGVAFLQKFPRLPFCLDHRRPAHHKEPKVTDKAGFAVHFHTTIVLPADDYLRAGNDKKLVIQ